MVSGNHSAAEVARQISRERAGYPFPKVTPRAPIAYDGSGMAEFAEGISTAFRAGTMSGEEFAHAMSTAVAAGQREAFESPTWKREGTRAYLEEARAAGYDQVDEASGEAYRLALPEPPQPPARNPIKKSMRILVRAHLPHVADLTDGEYGPDMDLAYGFEWRVERGLKVRFPKPGDIVLCPPTPHGPQVPFEARVTSTNQAVCNAKYTGPVKNIIKIVED